MSLIIALPCRDGAAIASDSRATYGRSQEITDQSPKVYATGSFALGMSGSMRLADGTDLYTPALDYWRAEDFRVTEESFGRFCDVMLARTREARPRVHGATTGNSWIVVDAEGDQPALGDVFIDFEGPCIRASEFRRSTPTTPLKLMMIGCTDHAAAAAKLIGLGNIRDEHGTLILDAADAAAFLVKVITAASDKDGLVGGAIGVTIVRPTPYAARLERALRGRS